jgi:hypothetical protein
VTTIDANAQATADVGPAGQPLPPGVHPNDPSVAWSGGPLHEAPTVPPDRPETHYQRGQQPFSQDNSQALPVFERAAHDWTGNTWVLTQTRQVAGRQVGRKSVTLWNKSSSATSVFFAPVEGEVDQGQALSLDPGDSITIPTEAPVYAGPGPLVASCTVQVMATYNPPGGGLGAN